MVPLCKNLTDNEQAAPVNPRPMLQSLYVSHPSSTLWARYEPFAHPYPYCQIQPLTFVHRSVNQPVIIRLKWGQTEYHGRLISVDSYMNIQLSSTEEYIDGKNTGQLGQVLIRYAYHLLGYFEIVLIMERCNNVLWISGDNGMKQEDVKMEG